MAVSPSPSAMNTETRTGPSIACRIALYAHYTQSESSNFLFFFFFFLILFYFFEKLLVSVEHFVFLVYTLTPFSRRPLFQFKKIGKRRTVTKKNRFFCLVAAFLRKKEKKKVEEPSTLVFFFFLPFGP
jgi:hypothetical protein